jgi:hypothetical protein
MKQPHQILFSKHSDAETDLERIGRELFPDEREQQGFLRGCWVELFWSCRAVWSAILAVWAILLVINLANGTPSEQRTALYSLSAEEIAWLKAQQLRFRTEVAMAPALGDGGKVSAPPSTGRGSRGSAPNSQSSNI